jgi:DNA polymerase IIIc chi subunit
MITRIAVAWTERTHEGTRTRLYVVLPDKAKIIRPDRMDELVDDLTVICEQLQAARERAHDGTPSAASGRTLRSVK